MNDGNLDYAYVVDTGGNIYRIDFLDTNGNPISDKANWKFRRIAYTNGGGRKFQFSPALLPALKYQAVAHRRHLAVAHMRRGLRR